MKNSTLQKLYKQLNLTSVFLGTTKKPLFQTFFAYCQAETVADKRRAYAKFVSVIYEEGKGNLTRLAQKEVFEDENVYIKSAAHGEKSASCIEKSVKRELETFTEFSALQTQDFASDLELPETEIPAFESFNQDMGALFRKRLKQIDKFGYGIFSSHGMFRLSDEKQIEPIASADKIAMDNFIGYEEEREKVVANTRAFIENKPAANVLLCGDAGTGKSSTVKAVANGFFAEGVRLIELRKDQLRYLPLVMGKISANPLKFIIFIDDLSFNQNDDNFSMLKAALEGSASAKADNAVIYATSNRRHIVKESFAERDGDDVHRNDTLQETLSLSERFGLVVLYSKPSKALYLKIVEELAKKHKIELSNDELSLEAEAFALRKGSRSARCAEQFIESLLSK